MLMKYFSFEELRSLKSKVIRKHQQNIVEEFVENEECICKKYEYVGKVYHFVYEQKYFQTKWNTYKIALKDFCVRNCIPGLKTMN